MTQNLYVGADLLKILDPGPPINAPPGLLEALFLPFKAAQVFQKIQQTGFYQRSESLADQITAQRPHLIGL